MDRLWGKSGTRISRPFSQTAEKAKKEPTPEVFDFRCARLQRIARCNGKALVAALQLGELPLVPAVTWQLGSDGNDIVGQAVNKITLLEVHVDFSEQGIVRRIPPPVDAFYNGRQVPIF